MVGAPVSLALVEIRAAGLADVVGDVVAPGHHMAQVAPGIDDVCGQRQTRRNRGFSAQAIDQCIHTDLRPGGCDGRLHVLASDLPGFKALFVPMARHQHRAARQPGKLRGSSSNGPLQLAPIGVDSNKTIQRPGRCNPGAGGVNGGLQTDRGGVKGWCQRSGKGVHYKPPEM